MKTKYWPAIISFTAFFSFGLHAADVANITRSDGSRIDYYLKQENSANDTLLVLIQGSDCNSVFHNKLINGKFSAVIDNADVLTVEKYGITNKLEWSDEAERNDCPNAYLLNDSPEQRVNDYAQVIEKLKSTGKYSKVISIGGSEGAVIANSLASQYSFIDFTVSLNGGGRWFVDDVIHNIKATSPSQEAYDEASKGFLGFQQQILNSEPFPIVVSGHGYKWWKAMFIMDQTAILTKITTPTFLIQSGKDENVSVDLAMQQAQVVSQNNSNIEFKLYDDLDHAFKLPNGVTEVDSVIADIHTWLTQFDKQSTNQ